MSAGCRFDDSAVLITGASQGIGEAVADRFAAEGADLLLVARPADADSLEETAERLRGGGARVATIAVDQADPESGRAAVGAALKAYGRIDVVIANAGASYVEDLLDSPDEHWREMIDINLSGTYWLASAAAREMVAAGRGAIGMTASTCAWLGEEQMVAYNVAKAGVVSLARSLGVALARHGVRVNAVAPGWVATPLAKPKMNTPFWEASKLRIPMRRAAEPEEIAAAFAYLCSDEASYVTGHVLTIDGAQTAGLSYPREMFS